MRGTGSFLRPPLHCRPPRKRGCGGIGRRARFRSVWGKPRGGSSPLIRIASSGGFCARCDHGQLRIVEQEASRWTIRGSRSCVRRGSDSWLRPTPSAAGSSASCTTAPSSIWSGSQSTSSWPAGWSRSIRPRPARCSTTCGAISGKPWTRYGSWRNGSIRRSSRRAGSGAAFRCGSRRRQTRIEVAESACPPEIATTVYQCCLEALEHAGEGASATITVREEAGALLLEIVEDGSGTAAAATDLALMRERVEALGGQLTIESEPPRASASPDRSRSRRDRRPRRGRGSRPSPAGEPPPPTSGRV